MKIQNKIRKHKHEIFVGIISSLFQIIFYYSVRINFECDSAAYYNSAIGLFTNNPSLLSPYRGPVYPILLRLFGLTTHGQIMPVLIYQSILGILISLILFLIVRNFGLFNAYLASSLYILSSIPFTSAKLILAEQTFLFLTILSIFSLYKLLTSNNKFFWAIVYSIVLCLACLTRWESLSLFIASVIIFIFLMIYKRKMSKEFIIFFVLSFFIFLGYAMWRVDFYQSKEMFGLQNGTGSQWLWRQYYSNGFNTQENGKGSLSGSIKNSTGAFRGDSIQFVKQETINYVLANSLEWQELVKIFTDNKNYNKAKLIELEKTIPNKFLVEDLIDEAWQIPTTSGSHISFLMSRAVISKYGLAEGDKILQKAALNILISDSHAKKRVIIDGASLLGFAKFDLTEKIQWFEGPPVNIGGCLNSTENMNFINNHNLIYKHYNIKIHEISSILRNILRPTLGFMFIAVLIFSILKKRISPFTTILTFALILNILIVSLTGGGRYGKYDLTIFTYLTIITFCQVFIAKNDRKFLT